MNARIPTRAGWWLGQRNAAAPRHTDNPEPHPIAVTMRGGKLCAGTSPVTDHHWTWLAPIPGPAVMAALAEYGEAVSECDATPQWGQGKAILARYAAESRLQNAIRAERDGAA